jgi:uroporphyrinogen-III decarboxylase
MQGQDIVWQKTWDTPAGRLQEQLRYAWHDSTLEQEKFLISDYVTQAEAFDCWLQNRRFEFDAARWQAECKHLSGGMLCAGELVSPLKMLHLVMGPEQTTFFLADQPDRAASWMRMHHRQQIEALHKMLEAGIRSVMSMDNLDTMFHPPHYIKNYSAEFYEEAAALCHRFDAVFLIHACGRQRDNLALISSLGVDGLEGVVYPPMGDVSLLHAFEMTGDKFMITGGISALEFERLATRDAVFEYVQKLFSEMRPFRNRFVFSASCNTPINARWEQIIWFRDAWRKFAV